MVDYVKYYNIFGNSSLTKHVPRSYLINDFDTRLKLFQGLMDTDGTIKPSGRVYFTTISKQLADDVIFLVHSFGGRTSTYSRYSTYNFNGDKKNGHLAYYITISLPKEIEPFQLERKLKIFRNTKRNNPSRGIKEIQYIGRKKCQCIRVENQDGLYLTNDFIVTHNTFSAIYLSTKIGLKTLFIVDKDSLYNQWIREIVNFTNISPDDIGIIKKNIFHTENKPFTISTVQTLLSKIKKEPKEMYERMKRAGFGFVVYDEVHNTSASEQYAKSSVIMSSPNIIGLSATPFKFGSQEILMKNVIGELLYNEQHYQLKPKIYFHYYRSDLEKMKYMMMKLDFIASKAYYNKNIVNSSNYLNLFPKLVKQDLKDKHKIIIICWTKNQVEIISSKLTECGIKNTRFYGEKREFSTDDDVLVATFKFAGTGKKTRLK